MRRAIGFILLLACSGKGAADTDTDTDTDTEDDTFGSFDESFELLVERHRSARDAADVEEPAA